MTMRSTEGPAPGRYPQMPVDARAFRTLRASGVQNRGVRAFRARFIAEDRYKSLSDLPAVIEWVLTGAR
jgi:hypothetical protein